MREDSRRILPPTTSDKPLWKVREHEPHDGRCVARAYEVVKEDTPSTGALAVYIAGWWTELGAIQNTKEQEGPESPLPKDAAVE